MTFKFSENQVVTSLDDVDDNLRGYYAESDEGGFVLRPELKDAAAAWDGMSATNTRVRKEVKEMKGSRVDLAPLSEFGSSVDEILSAVNNRVTELTTALEAKSGDVNPEKIRASIAEGFAEKERALVEKNKALEGQLYKTLVKDAVGTAISAHKGDAVLLMPHVVSRVKMVEVNGQLAARVVDGDGEVVYGGTGSEMTVPEFIGSLKKDKQFMKLFDSDEKGGGGPPPNRLSTAGPTKQAQRSAQDKISAGLAKRNT